MKRVLLMACVFVGLNLSAQIYPEGTRWTEIRLDTLKYDSWFSENGKPNYEVQEFYVEGQAELSYGIYNIVHIKRDSAPDSLAFYVKDGICSDVAIIVEDNLFNVEFYSFNWEERNWFFMPNLLVGKLWGAQWQTVFDFTEEMEGDFGGERPQIYANATAKVRRRKEPKNLILNVCVIKGIGVTSWPGPDCISGPSDASDTYDYFHEQPSPHPYRSMLVHFERGGEVLYDMWPKPEGTGVESPIPISPRISDDALYDLQGRRMNAAPHRGLYIQGGKMRMAW